MSLGSPQALVETLGASLSDFRNGHVTGEAVEDVSMKLTTMKVMLTQPGLVPQLAQEMYNTGIFHLLVMNLAIIEFLARKDVADIFSTLLRRQIGARAPTVDHIIKRPDTLFVLMKDYENPEIALDSGAILRECCKYEPLAKIILKSDEFFKFFDYVELPTADVASDAFLSFEDLLTRHEVIVAEVLEKKYTTMFDNYQQLLNSENDVTRSKALKLLSEILLNVHNYATMTRYISNPENLQTIMTNMMHGGSLDIQFEAFQVIKIFLANPNKPRPITELLLRNKDELLEFLVNFAFPAGRPENEEQFNDEKAYLVETINVL